MKKKKKFDNRAVLDYTLIVLGIVAILGFLMNLDYILKPQNKTKAIQEQQEKQEKELSINLKANQEEIHQKAQEIIQESLTKVKKQQSMQEKQMEEKRMQANLGKTPRTNSFRPKKVVKFTNYEEEKKKRDVYVKNGGKVAEAKVEDNKEVTYEQIADLKTDKEVQPLLADQELQKQKQERKENNQKALEAKEQQKRLEALENKKYEKDLSYLNEKERWYQGGTPQNWDVKIENGKKFVYIQDFGWINWQKASVGSRTRSKGTEEGLSGILIGH